MDVKVQECILRAARGRASQFSRAELEHASQIHSSFADAKKEVSVSDRDLFKQFRKRRRGLPGNLKNKKAKVMAELRNGHHKAWVHPDCKDILNEKLQAWSMKRSEFMNPHLCTVIIMDDISKMDDEIKLCAGISGLWVMSRTFLNSNGHRRSVGSQELLQDAKAVHDLGAIQRTTHADCQSDRSCRESWQATLQDHAPCTTTGRYISPASTEFSESKHTIALPGVQRREEQVQKVQTRVECVAIA